MKNLKYILSGVFTASILAMASPVLASEDVEGENPATEVKEVVEYDAFDLDEAVGIKNKTNLPHEKTEIKQTSYKGENTLEVKEEKKSKEVKKENIHADRVEIKGSNKNATGTNKEPGKLAWRNYRQGDLANFDIRTKNPDHITGAYIDRFLEKRGHYTPLKGHGNTILELSNKYGINVGIFMGQIAKETTFGMNAGGGKYNFGCIRYSKNGVGGKWAPAYTRGAAWVNPPTVRDGIEVTYKLMRDVYADKGYTTYKSFINRYSPAFENNHRSFEQLAAGTMNALNIAY